MDRQFEKDSFTVVVTIDPETGLKISERWLQAGVEHNPHGPSHIMYNDKGRPIIERYSIDGETHREEGPAIIHYDPETGGVQHESYVQSGKLHNSNGPAEIFRDAATGNITSKEYYLLGRRVPIKDWNGPN